MLKGFHQLLRLARENLRVAHMQLSAATEEIVKALTTRSRRRSGKREKQATRCGREYHRWQSVPVEALGDAKNVSRVLVIILRERLAAGDGRLLSITKLPGSLPIAGKDTALRRSCAGSPMRLRAHMQQEVVGSVNMRRLIGWAQPVAIPSRCAVARKRRPS